jgi:hypothetical protein
VSWTRGACLANAPVAFGLICAHAGYPAAFALTSALILAAVPVAVRERKAVSSVARPAGIDAGAPRLSS